MNSNLIINKNSNIKLKSLKECFNLNSNRPIIIAGPCSVEDENGLNKIAGELHKYNVKFLRGGIFKPRTSPYSFQGIGNDGLSILSNISKKYNMLSVSEVTDTRLVSTMAEYIDVFQIGSRNMQNYELLKEVGLSGHPVILKRGMSATIEEFLLAAEYIALNGNRNIIMCERGIRTFETETRNTLDFACICLIKKYTQLPVIADISHSLGRTDIAVNITKALLALGTDGIMVETHNEPNQALSDKEQQLNFNEFKTLYEQCFN